MNIIYAVIQWLYTIQAANTLINNKIAFHVHINFCDLILQLYTCTPGQWY